MILHLFFPHILWFVSFHHVLTCNKWSTGLCFYLGLLDFKWKTYFMITCTERNWKSILITEVEHKTVVCILTIFFPHNPSFSPSPNIFCFCSFRSDCLSVTQVCLESLEVKLILNSIWHSACFSQDFSYWLYYLKVNFISGLFITVSPQNCTQL